MALCNVATHCQWNKFYGDGRPAGRTTNFIWNAITVSGRYVVWSKSNLFPPSILRGIKLVECISFIIEFCAMVASKLLRRFDKVLSLYSNWNRWCCTQERQALWYIAVVFILMVFNPWHTHIHILQCIQVRWSWRAKTQQTRIKWSHDFWKLATNCCDNQCILYLQQQTHISIFHSLAKLNESTKS